ncbi:hypothetical protein K3Z84_06010, partial [Pseudomonas aeruginosa]|nr:hypothetical protein [Pseudomonas aeruginosa]
LVEVVAAIEVVAHEYRETCLKLSAMRDALSAIGGLDEVPLQRGVA